MVWLSPTPSDSNRKWWENILNANKAVSIDLHQGYKSKLNNKFWKVLQFRETDHLSGRSIPSVSHTPSTSSSYTLEAKFYKYLFFRLKFLTYEVFLLVLCLPYQFPLNHPSQQKDLGVWMVIISKPHISVSYFLYTSAVKGSDLWDAKLAQTLWSSAKNSHGAVQPNHYSNITQKFSIIHRRVRPQFQIKCLHGLWVYSNI